MVSHSDAAARHALVTGLHGFTGEYVRDALVAAGYNVSDGAYANATAPTGPNPGKAKDSVADNLAALDITSLEQCRQAIDALRPTHIVHLAAISFVAHDDALDMYRVNVLGTLNLLQACADVGHCPDRILIASSANVYGNAAGIVDESVVPAPVNHYAASKLAMEHMVRTWFDRLPIVMTRPFNYTGRGQSERFLVPKIVSHFVRKEARMELGNLDVARDFSDVRTVAQIYRALLESDAAPGEVVNVCSGHPYTLQQVVQLVREASGHDLEIRVNPAFVRQNEVKMLAGSARKLQRLVPGLQPIDLRDTIRWMVQP
ncbi:GDP-mannose 4,6-dehydratase [Paraburkholderia solisilvae]|uniref:GDP-mannose 4,6-dehydratase n=1 Tax=Paraburkholderia solisilvae TaxID=624376 RepID=A0A6J5E0D2_9BURK|nr:GDP-mannose 4,6-dehydratase [Paraburkholderia solisilvae]CAB3759858.1 GDP-mannose 4,6-dehydratase [Paraburkholderia solisilvae]